MRRGTTPTLTISTDMDLRAYTVQVALRQSQTEMTLTPGAVTADSLSVTLTQEQTLALDAGECARLQVRAVRGGTSYVGDVLTVPVEALLTGGELA